MGSFIGSFQQLLATAILGLRRHLGREEGQTFVEYALILGVLAIGAVGALTVLSGRIADMYSTVSHSVGSVL